MDRNIFVCISKVCKGWEPMFLSEELGYLKQMIGFWFVSSDIGYRKPKKDALFIILFNF